MPLNITAYKIPWKWHCEIKRIELKRFPWTRIAVLFLHAIQYLGYSSFRWNSYITTDIREFIDRRKQPGMHINIFQQQLRRMQELRWHNCINSREQTPLLDHPLPRRSPQYRIFPPFVSAPGAPPGVWNPLQRGRASLLLGRSPGLRLGRNLAGHRMVVSLTSSGVSRVVWHKLDDCCLRRGCATGQVLGYRVHGSCGGFPYILQIVNFDHSEHKHNKYSV